MSRLSNLPPGVTERMLPGVDDDEPTCAECGDEMPFDRLEDHSFCVACEALACDGCNRFVPNGHGHYPEGQGHYGSDRLCDDCYATALLEGDPGDTYDDE